MTFSWKQAVKSAIIHSGTMRLCSALRPPSAAILCYHSVSGDREGQGDCISPGITVETNLFDEHMRILRKNYHPVTLDDIADWLEHKKPIPRRAVAVTFDDGFADNYHLAASIMEKYGIRGAIYLAVDAVRRQELPWYCRLHYLFHKDKSEPQSEDCGCTRNLPVEVLTESDAERFYAKSCVVLEEEQLEQRITQIESQFGHKLDLSKSPGMMTFEQAKELIQRGHIIGSHTLSHGTAGLLTAKQLHREIGEANQLLERELGVPMRHFSYPHPYQIDPQWNEDSLKETQKAGYKTAVLTRSGLVKQGANPLLLPRLYIGNESAGQFRWKLESAFAGLY